MAPGNESTRVKLMDENRRPSRPRRRLDANIAATVPVGLNVAKFHHTLRFVRRGAAGIPSVMSGEHLKTVFEGLLSEVAAQFARAEISEKVLKAIRLGRMTTLQKPDGGVWGIVVGDVFLVARTFAQTVIEGGRGREPGRSVSPTSFKRDK